MLLGGASAVAVAAADPGPTGTPDGGGTIVRSEVRTVSGGTNAVVPRPGNGDRREWLTGVVTAIDVGRQVFRVQATNATVEVHFPTNGFALLPNRRIRLEDLRVGDRVGVVGRREVGGRWEAMAVRVAARPPGAGNAKRLEPGPTP